ncbi:MAG: metal-dependent hydrolase [Chloroflexi bacterium]|nr:metal-dependent hydrolase [Chloroflexota bacterium]
MKGIAHFITGVAIATFFPEVVQQAVEGSLLPMLVGIAGILPDTLDFKFARYFERYDLEIDPRADPDPGAIANALADAMRRAYEGDRPQNVMAHTIRLGADLWRQYTIRFDPEQSEVAVRIGPVVNTGQVPLPGSEPEGAEEVCVKIGAPMVHTYDAENKVDIFSGPSFKFERRGDQLHVHFLDWHRRWSHSLTLAAALGLLGWLVLGKWGGLVIGLGFAGHVLEDQLGFMGSNLFYPFTKKRTSGLQLIRSGDGIPNFLTVWVSVALILFNLDRFSAQPMLSPWWFLGLAVALPVVVLGGLYRWQRRHGEPETKEALRQRDIVSETEEVEIG